MRRSRVLIIQAMCKQYRAPLFARMYEELAARDIDLKVAYSDPLASHKRRNDDVELPASYGLKIPARTWLDGRICWQMPLHAIRAADLVIVEYALKHVINYPLLALARLGQKRVGFWLHGGTLRHPSAAWMLPFRRWTLAAVDWIFSYTVGGAEAVTRLGFPSSRVTPLGNAIDLSSFRQALEAVREEEVATVRLRLGIPPAAHVALFCGSLYPGRGIEFLLEMGDRLARIHPEFHLVVVGAGPLAGTLQQASEKRQWLHLAGSLFGADRAVYFRLAQVCIMPFLAGLGILDAMAAGLPFIVTGANATNPEIEYLVDGVTGLIAGEDPARFAEAIQALLQDAQRLQRMSQASRAASFEYSIERMSANFCGGIHACLTQKGRYARTPSEEVHAR